MLRLVVVLVACLLSAPHALAQPAGTDVTVPLTVKGIFGEKTLNLSALEYRPEGSGPFPAVVISHGSPGSPRSRPTYSNKFPVASAVFVHLEEHPGF